MATIPVAQKFHTVSSTVNTVDHGSAEFQSQRGIYTMQDIIDTVSFSGGSIDGSGAQYALPVFTDTNTITNLPLGNAGEILTSGGAGVDPSWASAAYLPLAGGTMAGNIAMGGNSISGVGDFTVGGAMTVEAGGDTTIDGELKADGGLTVTVDSYADNAAAIAGGLAVGAVYRNTSSAGGDLLGIVH